MAKESTKTNKKQPVKASVAAGVAINIGISDEDRAAMAQGLSRLLADTYTLYLTTHNFHWNVTGPMFNALHNMFMVNITAYHVRDYSCKDGLCACRYVCTMAVGVHP